MDNIGDAALHLALCDLALLRDKPTLQVSACDGLSQLRFNLHISADDSPRHSSDRTSGAASTTLYFRLPRLPRTFYSAMSSPPCLSIL